MQNQIDITTITDLVTLKSYAYDQLVILENAKNNLALINQQISKITKPEVVTEPVATEQ